MAFRVEKPNPDAVFRVYIERGWRRSRVQIMASDELSHIPKKVIDSFREEGGVLRRIGLEGEPSSRRIVMQNPTNVFEFRLRHDERIDPHRVVLQRLFTALGRNLAVTNPIKGFEIRKAKDGYVVELHHGGSFFLPEENGFLVLARRKGSTTIKVQSGEIEKVFEVLARILAAKRSVLNEVSAYALI